MPAPALRRIPARRLRQLAVALSMLGLVLAAIACGGDSGERGEPYGGRSEGELRLPPPTDDGAVVMEGVVTRVVDGDTIRVEVRGFETVVRLVGVDTPETVHPSRAVECWGPEASDLAERLMAPGSRVRLETDPTQDVRDRFGRLLAHVYIDGRAGPDSVNRRLVAEGAARVYVFRDREFRHLADFRAAERAARSQGRGLWGPPCNGGETAGGAGEPHAALAG